MGNYGLDQSFFKVQKNKKKRENKIVIFGFVPETICRIQSSWKNYLEFGNLHGFKPSVYLDKNLKFKKNFLKNHKFSDLKKVIKKINQYERFYREKYLKYNFSFPIYCHFVKIFLLI